MNRGDHILMTELIAQMKLANEKKDAAERELGLWLERMKLAQDAGKDDLFEAARERARRCRDVVRQQESVLMELDVEKRKLKGEAARGGRVGQNAATVARTQALVESLKGTPMDPTEARFERMEKESDADDELAALKKKMGM